ncbi:hypothetical protein HMPREF3213_00455 [Heyndrickxia coagulans]|uniref:Uncharacterized protein n=1 Tax=Heyndrickxia coagulans TaxID=1398 RepID=A0A133KZZ9_HEYCO|nr:hypothetical protein HMPREF3213_00455 [Heyndrickxia coagulans]
MCAKFAILICSVSSLLYGKTGICVTRFVQDFFTGVRSRCAFRPR